MKWLLVLVALAGCGDDNECATIVAEMQATIDRGTACTDDSDCVFIGTNCGLPGYCGVAVNAVAAQKLDALEQRFGPGATRCLPPGYTDPGFCACQQGAYVVSPVACVDGACACTRGRCLTSPPDDLAVPLDLSGNLDLSSVD
jgi:hypothetical protein